MARTNEIRYADGERVLVIADSDGPTFTGLTFDGEFREDWLESECPVIRRVDKQTAYSFCRNAHNLFELHQSCDTSETTY